MNINIYRYYYYYYSFFFFSLLLVTIFLLSIYRNVITSTLQSNTSKYILCSNQTLPKNLPHYMNHIIVIYNTSDEYWHKGYIINYSDKDGFTILFDNHNIIQYSYLYYCMYSYLDFTDVYYVLFTFETDKSNDYNSIWNLPDPSHNISLLCVNTIHYYICKDYLFNMLNYFNEIKSIDAKIFRLFLLSLLHITYFIPSDTIGCYCGTMFYKITDMY